MSIDLKSKVVVNSEGWLWPKDDGNGDYEGSSSCWHYMKTHNDTPQLISNHVKQKKVVVQAGGNAGYYVKRYSSLFECVYTFEPDPVNFYCLNTNVSESNVIKFQCCLGNTKSCVGLNKTTPDTGSTHVSGKGFLPILKVDDLGLEFCDLIHLDIEGYELFALEGAKETILKFKPVIALEYHDAWAKRYDTTIEQIENFLKELKYTFIELAQGDRIYKYAGV